MNRRRRPGGSRSLQAGLAMLGALGLLALAAPWIAPVDPFALTHDALQPPGPVHPFGTDDLGRDVFAGVVHGALLSLTVGLSAAAVSALIGLLVGGAAGAAGANVDHLLMRATEFAQALPRFFLVITVVSLFGSQLWLIILTIGVTAWPATARVFRAQVISLMGRDFVAASRAAGAHEAAILVRHVFPMAWPVLAAQVSYQAGGAILAEAGLSFLGLGDGELMSWGAQLGAAQHFVREAWWMAVFPGLAVTMTVLACNLLADGAAARARNA